MARTRFHDTGSAAPLRAIEADVHVIIFHMEQVPSADVMGLVAMEGVLREMAWQNIKAIFVDLYGQALEVFERGGLQTNPDEVAFCATGVEDFHNMDAKRHTYRRRNLGPTRFLIRHREKVRIPIAQW